MTGWFNIVGLVGIVASVGYGAALFLNELLGLYGVNILGLNFGDDVHILGETWLLFFLIMVFYTLVNIYDCGLALMKTIRSDGTSSGWRSSWASSSSGSSDDRALVFGERINNSGLPRRLDRSLGFGCSCSQLLLLTMYTQTGYDASAHTAEETKGAAISPPRVSGARSSSRR